MKLAKEGVHYTKNSDGSINTKRGGRYLIKDGKVYINNTTTTTTKEVKEDEIQK